MKELCNRAVSGNLRASRFRSVCWRVLLGVFPHAKDGEPAGKGWLPELQQCRKHYALLYQKLLADPWHGSLISGDDPLSQNSEVIIRQKFYRMTFSYMIFLMFQYIFKKLHLIDTVVLVTEEY